ncbi:hypothetical protein [Micromonospora maris]|uniref:hypothetical protein n=1 Tax=Micromonospora maris TaxID=1003110 RepID=UPI002E0ECF61|nr:hypothetical protein OG712_04550 [Micromonospora maris]
MVIVSQTCDVVREDPALLAVAPVVELPANKAGQAKKGVQPNFVHIPGAGDTWFADLSVVGTVSKSWAAQCSSRRGATSDEESSRFARLVGRKFSRFAFPDDVTYWFKPLQSVAQTKHDNIQSAEGRAFQRVEELRVATAEPWSKAPHELTLIVILKRDVLPEFPDGEYPEKPPRFDETARPKGQLLPPDRLATMLEGALDPVEKYWLWQALAEAWAVRCVPRGGDIKHLQEEERARILSVIANGEISFELTTVDEFSLYRYVRSEMLDLDYLSPADGLFRSMPQLSPTALTDPAKPRVPLQQRVSIRLKSIVSKLSAKG